MRDAIRMAADGIHYLVVFDDHSDRPIYLARQRRIASTDQRIICYARDGGCTRPNCLEPGYHSEVHHSPDWATGSTTLFFACGPDHKRASDGDYQTTVTDTGRLAWTRGWGHLPLAGDTPYAATPTHPTTNRNSRHQRQGQPHGCQNGLPYPPP